MFHTDHIRLIEKGITKDSGGVWGDFGAGEGAFTLALRDIAGPDVEIYSVDIDSHSLSEQEKQFERMFPGSNVHFLNKSFTEKLDLPPLDGIIAANSIHFHPDTANTINHLAQYLKPNGSFIFVEYNVDHGNHWVPYPFSFKKLQSLLPQTELKDLQLLHTIPSQFLNEIYSARGIKNK